METRSFILLGHDCPLGFYPAPVVPIGLSQGKLVAVYRGDAGVVLAEVSEDADFVRHDKLLKEKLLDFDPEHDLLFGIDSEHVVSYHAVGEADFFRELLNSENFSSENPFLRLSLAKATLSRDIVLQELNRCRIALNAYSREFLKLWDESQERDLRESFGSVEEFRHVL